MSPQPTSTLNGPAPIPRAPVQAAGGLARLRAAGRDFARAWGRPRGVEKREDLRVFAGIAALAFIAALVGIGITWDAELSRRATRLSPDIVRYFAAITSVGTSGYVFAVTGLVTLAALLARGRGAGRRRDAALAILAGRAFFLLVVAAVSGLASLALKVLFGRARPKLLDIVGPLHFDAFSFNPTFASFPSGHAVTAFAMAVGLAAIMPKLRWPLIGLAVLVAASRVVLGSHYLSDVLAGAALGYASAVLVRRAFAARRIVFCSAGGPLRVRGAGLLMQLLRRGGPVRI